VLGQSRVFYSMSTTGCCQAVLRHYPRFRTPYRSNLLFLCFVGLFAAFAPIQIVGEMTSIGTLFAFVLVCAGILVMPGRIPLTAIPHALVPLVRSWNPVVPALMLGWG